MRKKVVILITALIVFLFAGIEFVGYHNVDLKDYIEHDDSYKLFKKYTTNNSLITLSYKETDGIVENVKLSYASKTAFTLGNDKIFAIFPNDFFLDDYTAHVYSVFFSKDRLISSYSAPAEGMTGRIGWYNKRNFVGINVNTVEAVFVPRNVDSTHGQLDVETFLDRKCDFNIDWKVTDRQNSKVYF